jgi:hypothetical protein
VLQYIGTDLIRVHYPRWHIDQLVARAGMISGPVAIGDCRFPDELRCVTRELGGKNVFVDRESQQRAVSQHSSETSIGHDDCDYFIHNDSSIESLYTSIYDIIHS